jgi:hypothetical protein
MKKVLDISILGDLQSVRGFFIHAVTVSGVAFLRAVHPEAPARST